MRNFGGQTIELLAPAGNFDIFREIVKSGCDAIYLGGRTMNMRLIRKGFNFSDEEIAEAVKMAHDTDKKVYITVNNLMNQNEIEAAKKYLSMLGHIAPDALIVQDLGIVKLLRQEGIPLQIHASVMMNVYNLPAVQALKRLGISRVVMSRNNTLSEIRHIRDNIEIEIEYFTHGDMCIAHGAQCYYSAMLFGMSSNKGKCLKPCRWWFSADAGDEGLSPFPDDKKTYPLAVKDMCMYQYLPEMIHAGVNSFKIEGRMREKDFIVRLVDLYGEALDRYIEDPIGWDPNLFIGEIHEARKRDLSTASAFGRTGKENLNTRWEGTGKFFSTGRMFSTPAPEQPVTEALTGELLHRLSLSSSAPPQAGGYQPKLSVRVNNMRQAKAAADEKPHRIYAAGDVFNPDAPFSLKDIRELSAYLSHTSPSTELYAGTPRMMNGLHLHTYRTHIEKLRPYIDGLLVGDLGAIELLKGTGLTLIGDFSLNAMNALAAELLLEQGLSGVTASIELNAENLKSLCEEAGSALELIAYGRLEAMYFDHDFFDVHAVPLCSPFSLYNEGGRYDIYIDQHHRTHMLTTHRFTLLPLIEAIRMLRPAMLRLELQTENHDDIPGIIRAFKRKENLLDEFAYSYEALRFKESHI